MQRVIILPKRERRSPTTLLHISAELTRLITNIFAAMCGNNAKEKRDRLTDIYHACLYLAALLCQIAQWVCEMSVSKRYKFMNEFVTAVIHTNIYTPTH